MRMTTLQTDRKPGALENALSHLQCILVAQRTRYTPEKVNWAQYDILELLRIHGPMTPSLIGNKLGAPRTGISKSLRVLKDLKLVEQTQQNGDRREQLTALTNQGFDFLMRAASGRHDTALRAMGALTPGEQAIFAELCEKVSVALTKDDGERVVHP